MNPLHTSSHLDSNLSKYAAKNVDALRPPNSSLRPDTGRTEYQRDYTRILFSFAFRRLKHKSQVFYAPENDHISTRMNHSLEVCSIAETLCHNLKLNVDLAKAIAIGHDLGHAPFGHTGEEILDSICVDKGLGHFMHEAHSLRVVDTMRELNGETLKLTYQVRDGIVCHCGEQNERVLEPDTNKELLRISMHDARISRPFTLEGCVVRYVDQVAYLAGDLRDALELEAINVDDIPNTVATILGTKSGDIIGKIRDDMVRSSQDKPYIATSQRIFDAVSDLHKFSSDRIYNCRHIEVHKPFAKKLIQDLCSVFVDVLDTTDKGRNLEKRRQFGDKEYVELFDFVNMMRYPDDVNSMRIVVDYIAGMTDIFVLKRYREIFLSIPTP